MAGVSILGSYLAQTLEAQLSCENECALPTEIGTLAAKLATDRLGSSLITDSTEETFYYVLALVGIPVPSSSSTTSLPSLKHLCHSKTAST